MRVAIARIWLTLIAIGVTWVFVGMIIEVPMLLLPIGLLGIPAITIWAIANSV